MMRIGAALGSSKIHLLASHVTDQIKILDELPDCIGLEEMKMKLGN